VPAAEDLQLVYGESYLAYKGGFTRHEIANYLIIAHITSLSVGPVLGILSDHMLVYFLNRVAWFLHPSSMECFFTY
jgi:hypothetical protein